MTLFITDFPGMQETDSVTTTHRQVDQNAEHN